MSDVLGKIGEGLEQSFLMAYEVWWALVLGFAISGIVQAWVPRERIELRIWLRLTAEKTYSCSDRTES